MSVYLGIAAIIVLSITLAYFVLAKAHRNFGKIRIMVKNTIHDVMNEKFPYVIPVWGGIIARLLVSIFYSHYIVNKYLGNWNKILFWVAFFTIIMLLQILLWGLFCVVKEAAEFTGNALGGLKNSDVGDEMLLISTTELSCVFF